MAFPSRPMADVGFPILTSRRNRPAEMLLQALGREVGGNRSRTGVAKTERVFQVKPLAGCVEWPDGAVWAFATMPNQPTAGYGDVPARLDAARCGDRAVA